MDQQYIVTIFMSIFTVPLNETGYQIIIHCTQFHVFIGQEPIDNNSNYSTSRGMPTIFQQSGACLTQGVVCKNKPVYASRLVIVCRLL